ncbi:hypothetical protein GOBAR_DD00864 [Gossypium barbadense]|nr:hypothetical protein GOBAR_DD00864 [Gossypium barbadense]
MVLINVNYVSWAKPSTKRSTWDPHSLNAVKEAQLERLQTSSSIRYEQVHYLRNAWRFYLMEKSLNSWDDADFNTLDEAQLDGLKPCNEAWSYGDNSVTVKIHVYLK